MSAHSRTMDKRNRDGIPPDTICVVTSDVEGFWNQKGDFVVIDGWAMNYKTTNSGTGETSYAYIQIVQNLTRGSPKGDNPTACFLSQMRPATQQELYDNELKQS